MSDIVEVMVLIEGQTEQTFINSLFSPYIADLTEQKVFLTPTRVGKQGGDVRFSRYQKDIGIHLKQRTSTYITLMVDYYGIKDWPGLEESKKYVTHSGKGNLYGNNKGKNQVCSESVEA